ARRWYEAIGPTAGRDQLDRQNADVFTDAVRSNPSVRRLVTNPLLLTLAALAYWRVGHLPQRRIELYSYATQMLLTNWVQRRASEVSYTFREAMTLLMTVAFHVHSTSNAGLIARDELEYLLERYLTDPERGGFGELMAREKMERFLDDLVQH